MTNRYTNLDGTKKISDTFGQINTGFDTVQTEMDTNKQTVDTHIGNADIHVTKAKKTEWDSKSPGSTQTDLKAHTDNVDIHVTAAKKTEWDSKAAGNHTHPNATTTTPGFESAEDKAKLDGIQAKAEVNQSAFSKVNNIDASSKTDQLFIVAGIGITVSTDPVTKRVTITATGEATPGPHGSSHDPDGSDPIPALVTLKGVVEEQAVSIQQATDKANAAETPVGAQSKADAAKTAAITAASSDASTKANAVQGNLTTHLTDDTAHNLGNESLLTTTKTVKGAINEVVLNYVRQPAYAQTAGTAIAYTATLNPAPGSITDGFGITIIPHVDSGASPTLSINGLTAIPLKNIDGTAIQMKAGKPYSFRKVGTDFLASNSGGGVTIKTLQRGTSVIGINQDLINVTISSVDKTKAIIRFGFFTNTNVASKAFVLSEFSNNTTLLFSRNTADSSATVTIYWEVIEFGNVKSVQKGSTSSSSSSGATVTISEVNISNSLIFYSFNTTSTIASGPASASRFTNSTTISLIGQISGTGTNYFNYQVVEFND